jgi:DNA-binding HxlR family transcriptional regulator
MTEHQQRCSDRRIGRTIVLQLLRDDHDERWSRTELQAEVSDGAPAELSTALAHLEREGVVVVQGERVLASRCARHLDGLGLIAI